MILAVVAINGSTSTQINDSDIQIKEMFVKIHEVPYANTDLNTQTPDEFFKNNYGDCDDKSIAFLSYLKSRGFVNACLVREDNENGNSHVFVLWNNKVYDPVMDVYGGDYHNFLIKLKEGNYSNGELILIGSYDNPQIINIIF